MSQEEPTSIFSLQPQYIIKSKGHENIQNDHLRENNLIFEQILSTNSGRKCIEISLENLYVDLGA